MSIAARALGALSIPVITLPAVAGSALAAGALAPPVTAPVPKPPTKALPAGLDVASPYEPQRICDPHAKPGVVAFATLMSSNYKIGSAAWGITRDCNSGLTEHSEGRAWDWMLSAAKPNEKAIADSVTAWLSAPDAQGRPGAMARRFGIMYIIWNTRMWRAYDPARGWAPYTGSVPHTDHIHFSFSWDGAYGRTSWWTGKALTTIDLGPAPTPKPSTAPQTPSAVYSILMPGATGTDVALAQKVVGTTPDGIFGPKTEAALCTWQASHGVKVTGQLDAATWARMVALKLVPARPIGSPTTPTAPTPATPAKPTPATPSPAKPTPATPPPPAASATPTTAPAGPLAAYATTTLRRGSSGPAVAALQKVLGVTPDGQFGPLTEAAVKAFQTRRALLANGIVGPSTWAALMAGGSGSTGASRGATAPRPVTPPPAAPKPATPAPAVPAPAAPKPAVPTPAAPKPVTPTPVPPKPAAPTPAAAPTAATPYTPLMSTVLRDGSRGQAVRSLQRALGGLAVDGAFGPRTAAAVVAFQRSHHLPATGVADARVWLALEARDYPLRGYYTTVLRTGSHGAAVAALQQALGLRVDAVFGPGTVAAVKALQGRAMLARTGVVATVTWRAVEAELRRR